MAVKGVDLSKHNGSLKIADVKKAGYDFVILRGAYTGYSSKRPKVKDPKFEDYYKQCKALKMPVGCYYYSCATSKAGGINEANFLYDNCLKGKTFEYPIYIDVEESRWQAHNKKGVTDAIIGFCETLKAKGYKNVGIYASVDWFNNKIDTSRLNAYTKWVAAWRSTKPSFKYNHFDMWQNSDNGKIAGHRVDTNICYVDFAKPKEAPKPTLKPTPAKPSAKKGYTGEFPKLILGRCLKFGSSGNNVKKLQKFLNWYGNYKLDVDGAYGRKTESAVRDFQAKNGLAVDGKFGKKSLAKAKAVRK